MLRVPHRLGRNFKEKSLPMSATLDPHSIGPSSPHRSIDDGIGRLTLFIGGIAWIHQRAFGIYTKTTGHTAPRRRHTSTRRIGSDRDCHGCSHIGTGVLGHRHVGGEPCWHRSRRRPRTENSRSPARGVLTAHPAAIGVPQKSTDRLEERDRLDSVLNRVHHSESALGKSPTGLN